MWDLSLPGYKYLGPGNKLDKGAPTDWNDWVAFVHDLGYGKIIEAGENPYIHFSDSDEEALANFDWSSYGGILAQGYFGFKKKLWQAGLIKKHNDKQMSWLDDQLKKKAAQAAQATEAGRKALRGPPQEVTIDEGGDITDTEFDGPTENTDIVEFKPSDAGQPTAGTKRDREGNPVMNDVSMETTTLARASGMSGEGSNGTGETPVDLNVPRELGILTETRTAYLPLRFGVSMNKIGTYPRIGAAAGNVLRIRLNTPYLPLRDTTFVSNISGASTVKGVSTHQAAGYVVTNPSSFQSFDTTIAGLTAQSNASPYNTGSGSVAQEALVPAYLNWYEKMYQSYHTIETKYRITLVNPENGKRTNVVHWMDSYTANNTTDITPTDQNSYFYRTYYKNIKQKIVNERTTANDDKAWIQVIEGVWRPGQNHLNTVNAEDIKAWYATNAEPDPLWVENLVLCGLIDEYTSAYSNLNIMVELTYLVQFKDLRQDIRYPTIGQSNIQLNIPEDTVQVPNVPIDYGGGLQT